VEQIHSVSITITYKPKLGTTAFFQMFLSPKSYHPIPWRDSISRPIAPISTVAGGDDTTPPGFFYKMVSVQKMDMPHPSLKAPKDALVT
jgi:hypothetical protein